MIPPLIVMLASLLVRLIAAFTRPSSAICPAGMFVEGVRPTGKTSCVLTPPPGNDCYRDAPCRGDTSETPRIPIRIYCDPGEQPLVINHRRVECRKEGARS
jgi:hypothetical protein